MRRERTLQHSEQEANSDRRLCRALWESLPEGKMWSHKSCKQKMEAELIIKLWVNRGGRSLDLYQSGHASGLLTAQNRQTPNLTISQVKSLWCRLITAASAQFSTKMTQMSLTAAAGRTWTTCRNIIKDFKRNLEDQHQALTTLLLTETINTNQRMWIFWFKNKWHINVDEGFVGS